MAENKKSFIAYSDWDGMFQALPDEVSGKLIKHIFSYVNDRNPTSDDYIINALFEQVKSTLKRDLKKWEEQKEQRSLAGKKSAELRLTKSNERSNSLNENERNSTVSVNVSVNDNDNDNASDINKRAHKHFAEKLFDAKDELDAIEVSTRKKPTADTLKRFNANLVNQNKHHNHYSEYKKHFISWLIKQPETTLVEPKQKKRL